jgi:hypothetical protein
MLLAEQIALVVQTVLAIYIAYRTLRQMYQSIFLVCEWALVLLAAWAAQLLLKQYNAGATPASLIEHFDLWSIYRVFMRDIVWSNVDRAIFWLEWVKKLKAEQE